MIEVEKKFLVEPEDIERIVKGAEFLGEKTNKDTYYDMEDFKLMKQDIYLRERNGKYELKIGVRRKETRGVISTYRELNSEDGIKRELEISERGELSELLGKHSYQPFGSWTTTRKQYRSGEFGIDIDSVDFGYDVVEVELEVGDDSEVPGAIQKILAFASELGLTNSPPTGKVSVYLERFYPEKNAEIRKAWDEFHNS